MKQNLLMALLACSLSLLAAPASQADKTENIKDAGDVIQILLPVSAFGLTLINRDKEGFYQYTKAFSGAVITSTIGKYAVGRLRPDASNTSSYPSGHTTAAFSGAAFIRMRYQNPWLSIPAYAGAGFVGYSRIRGNKHYRDDVLAGASVGMMWNWYAVTPMAQTVALNPMSLDDGIGVQFEYQFGESKILAPVYEDLPRVRYVYEFGPTKPQTNDVTAPPGTGTTIDFAAAQEDADFTSRILVSFYSGATRRHELEAYIAPIEIIDYAAPAELDQPVDFNGVTFFPNPDADISARFRYVELRGNYLYTLLNNEHWNLRLGGGISWFDTKVEIQQFTGTVKNPNVIAYSKVEGHEFLPNLAGRARLKLTSRWYAEATADFWPADDWAANLAGLVGFRANPDWELGIGARWLGSDFESNKARIEFSQIQWMAQITKTFY